MPPPSPIRGEPPLAPRQNLRTQVLYSLKWLAGARFAAQLVSWAITFVVIRLLTPADYGLMAIAEVLIGFAALFREMGLFSAMVQKRDLTERQVQQAFGILIIANCSIFVVVFALAPVLARFFDDTRLTNIVRVLAIQFPLAALGVVEDAMLNRRMLFKRRSLATLSASLGNGFTTLGFALSGAGVWALVFGSLASAVIRPIAFSVATRHFCRPRFSREGMGGMLRFGGFVTGTSLMWYVYSQADVFIIGKLLGKELLGFYSIAMQLAALPMRKVAELLGQVGFAAYSSIQDDMPAIRSHYLKAHRIVALLAFPTFWGISCIAPELVRVVLGQRWIPAALPLQLLGIVMPLVMIGGHAGGSVLTAIGKPHLGAIIMALAIGIMVPAFFIGTWYGGVTGAATAWVIGYPVLLVAQLRFSLPPLGLTMGAYFGTMARPALGGAVMYAAVMLVRTVTSSTLPPIAELALLVATGALIYPVFMWTCCRRECRECVELLRQQGAA